MSGSTSCPMPLSDAMTAGPTWRPLPKDAFGLTATTMRFCVGICQVWLPYRLSRAPSTEVPGAAASEREAAQQLRVESDHDGRDRHEDRAERRREQDAGPEQHA